jgi:hypothetical protein
MSTQTIRSSAFPVVFALHRFLVSETVSGWKVSDGFMLPTVYYR